MSPAKKPTTPAPTTDVTPEAALQAIEVEIAKAGGMWAKGPRVFACKTAGQRLANALQELHAAEAHAKALRDGMTQLVQDAINAVAGVLTPTKAKATPASQANGSTPDGGTAKGVQS
jgi:hypothetical protein